MKKLLTLFICMVAAISANAHYEMNISSVTGAPYCKGESFTLSFTIHFAFDPTNVYQVQMSNASGSFASPVVVGTQAGAGAATITCMIPANTLAGTGYLFRVVASSPAAIGDPTTTTYTVVNTPAASIVTPPATNFCSGDSVYLQANAGNNFQYIWYRNGVQEQTTSVSFRYVKSGGNHSVKVVEPVAGCNATSANVKLSLKSKPAATLSPAGTDTICKGDSLVLSANTGSGLTYQWYKGVNPIAGAMGSQYAANATGSYKVRVSNTWGCTKFSSLKKVVRVNCSRVADEEVDVTAWPMPFSSHVSVALDGLTEDEMQVAVIDLQGRIVHVQTVVPNTEYMILDFNTSEWPAGLYFLRMASPSINQTFKLIKSN
jgi:hypothetical protein